MKKMLTITFDTGSGDISSEWDEELTLEEIKDMCEQTWCKAVTEIETSNDTDTNQRKYEQIYSKANSRI
jgi:hypothetical protein